MRSPLLLFLCLSATAAAAPASLGAPPFPATVFGQLPTSGAGAQITWSWPELPAFRANWEKRARPKPLPADLRAASDPPNPALPTDDAAWRDFVYATTLLAADPPARVGEADYGDHPEPDPGWDLVEAAMHDGPAAGLPAVKAYPLQRLGSSDWRLGRAASYLAAHGEGELALTLYRRFHPVGRCSMDSAPAYFAREYADLCYRLGHVGCFLQLQVNIMGDQFDRVVYSSYGEAAHPTEVQALVEAGIDVRRFLRGLLLVYDAQPERLGEIDPWRLGRAMLESGDGAWFEQELRRLSADPGLDASNRLRATATLASMRVRGGAKPADVGAELSATPLHPAARRWLARELGER